MVKIESSHDRYIRSNLNRCLVVQVSTTRMSPRQNCSWPMLLVCGIPANVENYPCRKQSAKGETRNADDQRKRLCIRQLSQSSRSTASNKLLCWCQTARKSRPRNHLLRKRIPKHRTEIDRDRRSRVRQRQQIWLSHREECILAAVILPVGRACDRQSLR